ncbi:MAG TPA: hypothetical protein PKI89_07260, partial [Tepidiformaceae bacterium]|nr:hypothetical protein [Tepidiformaceae bacterium]
MRRLPFSITTIALAGALLAACSGSSASEITPTHEAASPATSATAPATVAGALTAGPSATATATTAASATPTAEASATTPPTAAATATTAPTETPVGTGGWPFRETYQVFLGAGDGTFQPGAVLIGSPEP